MALTLPVLGIDYDLRDAIQRSATPTWILASLESYADRPFTHLDRNAAEGIMLERGSSDIVNFLGGADSLDYLDDGSNPYPIDYIRRYLYEGAGAELFKFLAAAKYAAIM